MGFGMALASLQFGAIHHPAQATVSDNVMGFAWSDPLGWISMNDQNAGACGGGGCGTYGVNVDPSSRLMTGWAWSDQVGWMCFGSTCTNASCQNDITDPLGLTNAPDGFAPKANLDAGAGTVQVRGWAKMCALASKGWVSLNCSDPGFCGGVFPYKVIYASPAKAFYTGVHSPPLPTNITSLGWNSDAGGTGLGYFDFQYLTLNTPPESICADGIDNDLNGAIDCADAACLPNPVCALLESQCLSLAPTAPQIHACCSNGGDDTNPADGLVDCADPDCSAKDPACAPPVVPESQCLSNSPTLAQIHSCCSDNVDNTVAANGAVDCADADCQATDPQCTPAWLQTQFGNVYSQQGIQGSTLKSSTASYCLTSQGAITGFASDKGCVEAAGSQLNLPKSASGYKGTLGSLDIQGILAGRYGKVIELGNNVDVTGVFPAAGALAGKIYHATGNVTLGAKTYSNGSGPTDRGNGLLIVEGNLTITGNQGYAPTLGIQYLRELASVGFIVKKTLLGSGGNLSINPTVSQVVGVSFVENAISTGTACPGNPVCPADTQLNILGLIAAHQINLERNFRDPLRPAELIQFDGRGVANPPPGLADVAKSLPSSKDAF